MGKKKRFMNNPKFAKKYAAKFAKFKQALEEVVSTAIETFEEVVGEREEAKVQPTTVEPKAKPRRRKNSPRKKSSDSKKRPARKRKSPKKD